MNLARLSILALLYRACCASPRTAIRPQSQQLRQPSKATPAQAPATDAPAAASPDAASPALPAPPAAAPADSYIIGASDMLAITVWKENFHVRQRPGPPRRHDLVAASGRCEGRRSHALAALQPDRFPAQEVHSRPNVSVVVVAIHSKIVYLLGEVGKKGPLEMTPGMTMLQAIASAGGLTDYANTKKMYILRDEDGKHQKIPVRYKDALKGDSSLDVALKPGDTIVVP